jgi:two-component system sensor histidine kinase CpxA
MKSIFVRILLWISLLFVVSSFAFVATSYYLFRRDSPGNNFMRRVLDSQMDDLRTAWETGGAAALRPEIARLDARFPGRHALLDASGKDLLTGEQREIAAVEQGPTPFRWPFGRPPSRGAMTHRSEDRRYAMYVTSTVPRFDVPNYLPFYLPIVFVFVLGIYVLAHYIGRPLRQLRETVGRFGSGDLEARTGLKRRDEFGDVARSFDDMAERIQTLLTAERRLLQDISHELRSPLARLSVAVELARTSADRGRRSTGLRKRRSGFRCWWAN